MTRTGVCEPAATQAGSTRPEARPDARPAVLSRDGWAAFVLGTLSRCYLSFVVALTVIAALPLAFGFRGSVVQTGSMEPHISPGDLVLSTPLPQDSPIPLGGVVEFWGPAAGGGQHRVVHRIVAPGRTPQEWITKGDANDDADSTALTRDKITGQGRLLVRWVGLPSMWLAGHQYVPLVSWLAGTGAAVWLAAWSWPRDDERRRPAPGRRREHLKPAVAVSVVAVSVAGLVLNASPASSAAFTARTSNVHNTFAAGTWSTLSLGRATSYAILACTRIANAEVLGIGSSITGSIGVSPGTGVTGFWPWDVTGSTDKNTAGAVNARTDALKLYGDLNALAATGTAPSTLTGTVTPGVLRRSGPVTVSGTVTFDAGGDPSRTFVVSGSSLTFAPGATVALKRGAAPDKIFFVSGSTVTAGDGSQLRGVLLANGDVTINRDSTLQGRAISLQGAVTLTRVQVTQP
ncbi:hypothetical protein Cch01nite_00090 [Cellulomonas chitinilytica]|uniref:Signal peptidase I n=1 Tax=Cellulomonas chitinilytica TaxID=398759 RepID=A0A919NYC4_9CELL|nr:hypothetical protein Cch01nite_00090 [Cellulomonas chitinilytica]